MTPHVWKFTVQNSFKKSSNNVKLLQILIILLVLLSKLDLFWERNEILETFGNIGDENVLRGRVHTSSSFKLIKRVKAIIELWVVVQIE